MGILKLNATLDVAQFWPTGGSDADTARVIVDPAAGGFEFSAEGTRLAVKPSR